jgi:hypothetical protein
MQFGEPLPLHTEENLTDHPFEVVAIEVKS